MSTISSYTGDGSTTQFDITFDYADQATVKVRVDRVDVAFTFVNPTRVSVTPAPAAGTLVEVYRKTDVSENAVTFTDGAIIQASELNSAFDQVLDRAEEIDSEFIANGEFISAQFDEIEAARVAAVGSVNTAGTTQVAAVNAAGTTQVSAVNAAGATQTANAAAQAAAAAASVGAVKQIVEIVIQNDAGLVPGAWYAEFFVPVATTYSGFRAQVFRGSGTADVTILVDDAWLYGPRTVGTTADVTAPSLPVAALARVSVQLSNITGTPTGIAVQLVGLPT